MTTPTTIDKERLAEIRKRQVLRGNVNDRWYVDDIDYLLGLIATREQQVRAPLQFAVMYGYTWTLEDWRNWITNHAKPALEHPAKEGEG